jgi:DNA primase
VEIDKNTIEEIKNNVKIKDIVSKYTNIRNNKGKCPIHKETNGSFYIYPETNSWYCYGCSNGGDVIEFIEKVENIDFIDALKKLTGENEIKFINNDDYKKLNSNDFIKIIEQLKDIKPSKFDDEKWIEQYADNKHGYYIKRGFKKETLSHFKIGYCWDGSELHNRITIPWYSHDNYLVGVSGREINNNSNAKYICRKGSNKSDYLYNLNNVKDYANNGIIIVESEKDVWRLWEWGYKNAVALGNCDLNNRRYLLRKFTNKAILCLDNDKIGIKATKKLIKQLRPIMLVENIQLPKGIKDISDREDDKFKLKKEEFDKLYNKIMN